MLAAVERERERLRRRRKLRAETIGLKLRVVGQIAAADAGGKPEKVFDQGRGSGLSAGRVAFQNHGLQPFGRGINRRSQAGGTRADNREIAIDFALVLARRVPEQPRDSRDFAQRRAPQRHAVGGDQGRQVAAGQVQPLA